MKKKSISIGIFLLFCISISLLLIILTSEQVDPIGTQNTKQEFISNVQNALIYYSAKKNSPGFSGIEFGGLYLFDLRSKNTIELTEGSTVSQYEKFSWSPVTKNLVYTTRGENVFNGNLLELYSLDSNGNRTRLTNNNFSDGDAFIAPNGQTIAFWSSRPDNHWLYLMDSNGSNVRPFFDNDVQPEFGFLPLLWSPDSRKIAIPVRLPEEQLPIDLNNVQYSFGVFDFESRRELLSLPTNRVRIDLSWSADSRKLVYLSDPIQVDPLQTVNTSLYLLDLETENEVLVAEFAAISVPRWSPVKDIIAFTASTEDELYKTGGFTIYLINSDGTGLRQLTNSNSFFRVGSWSPDGKKLALEYVGEQLTDNEIYILDINSGTLEQITDNSVLDAHPIWVELE